MISARSPNTCSTSRSEAALSGPYSSAGSDAVGAPSTGGVERSPYAEMLEM